MIVILTFRGWWPGSAGVAGATGVASVTPVANNLDKWSGGSQC
jgi:hypothetical protein